jgi:hypothetical protein
MSLKVNDRLSVLKEDGLFSLVIYPVRNKLKLNLLFLWWILWTLCGVIFIANYVNYSNRGKSMRFQYAVIEGDNKLQLKKKTDTLLQIQKDIDTNQKQRLILIVLIGFWAYYEYKVGRAYLFRKFGFEKVWMKGGSVYYRREINKRGRTKKFDAEFVNEFTVIDYNQFDFFQNVSRSFWTLAGDSIEFTYHSKTMRFGIQLEEQQAKQAVDQLNKALKRLKVEKTE